MKMRSTLCSLCFLLTAVSAEAAPTPVVTVGTPGDSLLSTPTKPTPALGGTFLNFDTLTSFASYSTYSSGKVSISSPDGLLVLPYSTQSGPNELYDDSSDGSADILISLTGGTSAIGIGVADSDPVTLLIQALGSGGTALGAAFSEDLATTESSVNTGNGYYVVQDSSADIYGLQIQELVGNPNYSGLAIDDVQVASTPVAATPEPSSVTLLGLGMFGLVALNSFQRLKRA